MHIEPRAHIYEWNGHAYRRRCDGKWIVAYSIGTYTGSVQTGTKLSARRFLRQLGRFSEADLLAQRADGREIEQLPRHLQEQPARRRTAARRPSATPPRRPHMSKPAAGRNGRVQP